MIHEHNNMIIPEDELVITFARSSGKGGQNVNKTSTKVFVHWFIENSTVLTDDEKNRIRAKLANRINNQDELVVFSEEERSQAQNKELAIARLQDAGKRSDACAKNTPCHQTHLGLQSKTNGIQTQAFAD
jgi:ribosome-associated protein